DDFAWNPVEAVDRLELAAAFGHELHADADAEERPAALPHRLVERRLDAGNRGQAATAIGEGADARQHDALGPAHLVGVAGDLHLGVDAGLARGTLESLGGGAQVARPIVD